MLLKNTHAEGAQRMIERFEDKTRDYLNFVEPPLTFTKTQVENESHLVSLVGII